MFTLTEPSADTIRAFLTQQQAQPFTYEQLGATRTDNFPAGFNHDYNRIRIGSGVADFNAACDALRRWRMFAMPWIRLWHNQTLITPGETVAMAAYCYGGWWVNACRIVYVLDEPAPLYRYGFAYGTLTDHVECGEERFTIEWKSDDDSVWYDLRAFSRPRHPLVKLAKPLARKLQKRFVRESLAAMADAVRRTSY